jgi:response regulator of citrate/malate metabolism
MNDDLNYRQELYRAQAVIAKAKKNGENVGETLREHMVPQAIVLELTGEVSEYVPKGKRKSTGDKIAEWAKANIGAVHTLPEIADKVGVSYASVCKFVRENRAYFHKHNRGLYVVRDVEAERKAEKEAK